MGMSVGGGEEVVKSEPNVIPMIDIMLVLLIIFMIVTPVIAGGFTATMPQAENLEAAPDEDNDIILGIDEQGNYYLDPGTGSTGRLANEQLGEVLTSLYSRRTKDAILYFRADQGLEFSHVEDAMDIARKSGVRVLAAVTDQKRPVRR
ncbi:MAG: biopolymer transporter ExbD [Gemmatimonadota bacterium]|nr:biopolymer transporter ExbD [Gemmatimonadota bacterium]MDH5806018.1 biopolymer transporter ExbD [Gemmatimonadota bacterium]